MAIKDKKQEVSRETQGNEDDEKKRLGERRWPKLKTQGTRAAVCGTRLLSGWSPGAESRVLSLSLFFKFIFIDLQLKATDF